MKVDLKLLEPSSAFGKPFGYLYQRVGFLLLLSVIAFLGGAFVQLWAVQLPAQYTWRIPFDAFVDISKTENFPTIALLSFVLGSTHCYGWSWKKIISAWFSGTRPWKLGRTLAFLVGFALSCYFFEDHSSLDAISVGILAAFLVVPTTAAQSFLLVVHATIGVLLFAAVSYWFTVIKALLFVHAQPLDASIVAFESSFGGEPPHQRIARWASGHRSIVAWLDWAYFQIFYHMGLTLIVLIGMKERERQARYVAAMAICYFLGGPLYHLFPGLGPVYFDNSFFDYLRSQPLISDYVQKVLYYNTAGIVQGTSSHLVTWGYIACMPSLHMAHELIMTIAVFPIKIAFVISSMFLLLTGAAVLVLGWHYPTDILAGFVLGGFSWLMTGCLRKHLYPQLEWKGKSGAGRPSVPV